MFQRSERRTAARVRASRPSGRRRKLAIFPGAAIAVLLVGAGVASSQSPPGGGPFLTVAVNTTSDSLNPGPGKISLRKAFAMTNASPNNGNIVLQGGATYKLTVCSPAGQYNDTAGELTHTGAGQLTISGNHATIVQTCPGARVIDQLGPALMNLNDVSITGGDQTLAPGGGVFASGGGELDLKNSTVVGNYSAAAGGGVAAYGKVVLSGTTVRDNRSGEAQGGVATFGEAEIIKSTVADNTSTTNGGIEGANQVVLIYATVYGNTDPQLIAENGTLTSFGSVIGGPGGGANCQVSIATHSLGYNFDSGDAGGSCKLAGPHDKVNSGNPLLTPEVGTGGVAVLAPGKGSPLLNAIPPRGCTARGVLKSFIPVYSDITSDQLGTPRPQGAGCDVGSIEVLAHGRATACKDTTVKPSSLGRGRRTVTITVRVNGVPVVVRVKARGPGIVNLSTSFDGLVCRR